MKKVIWPILLFSFMIILAGCNVTNQEKGNQNDENAVDSLDAVPTMEEWMEWTQDAEEEEKAALYEQLQALLDEATEEEVQQAVENSVKDWAEKQEWLDVEAVFVELAADPLMMDEQTGERLYANRTAQVEIQYSREKGDATGLELQSLLLDQVAQAARGTPYGMFTLHTVQLACRRSADGVEVYGGSIGVGRDNGAMAPCLPEEEQALQAAAYGWVQQWNAEEFSSERFSHHGNVTLRRFGIRPSEGDLYAEIPIYEVDYAGDVEAFRNSLGSRAESLYRQLTAEQPHVQYLQQNGVQQVTVLFETPWHPEGASVYTFPLEI